MSDGDEQKPNLGLVQGGRSKFSNRPVTPEVHQKMALWWIEAPPHMRTRSELMRAFGLAESTAKKVINTGFPQSKLKSLKQLLADSMAKILPSSTGATIAAVHEATHAWAGLKRTHTVGLRNSMSLVALIQNDLGRRWQGQEMPLAGLPMSEMRKLISLVRDIAGAQKDLGAEARKWSTTKAPTEAPVTEGSPFEKLTEEQAKYMMDTGRIPAGVDPEPFYAGLFLPRPMTPSG